MRGNRPSVSREGIDSFVFSKSENVRKRPSEARLRAPGPKRRATRNDSENDSEHDGSFSVEVVHQSFHPSFFG